MGRCESAEGLPVQSLSIHCDMRDASARPSTRYFQPLVIETLRCRAPLLPCEPPWRADANFSCSRLPHASAQTCRFTRRTLLPRDARPVSFKQCWDRSTLRSSASPCRTSTSASARQASGRFGRNFSAAALRSPPRWSTSSRQRRTRAWIRSATTWRDVDHGWRESRRHVVQHPQDHSVAETAGRVRSADSDPHRE